MFYVTKDDEFIIKTVMHKEAEFLQKLLPGYYMVSFLNIQRFFFPLQGTLLYCTFLEVEVTMVQRHCWGISVILLQNVIGQATQ